MAKFSNTVKNALKTHDYGQGGSILPELDDVLDKVQDGIEEHDHSGGGAGTGTGPAIVGAAALAAAAAGAFQAGFISADADGRGLMGAGLFNEAAVDSKFANDAINGEKLKPGTVTGEKAADVAAGNTVPGMLVVHHILADQAGGASKDVTVAHKIRVLDVIAVNKATGGAGDGVTVKNAATAITNLLDMNAADQTVVRATTIDDAQATISAGGTLRVTKADGANDQSVDVFVIAMRVA